MDFDKIKQETLSGITTKKITSLYGKKKPIELILLNNLCPGDCLVMTASIAALHKKYPGVFKTSVCTHCDDVYKYNPYVNPVQEGIPIWTSTPLINAVGRRNIHFMDAYVDFLSWVVDLEIPPCTLYPEIYLSDNEKNTNLIFNKYGVENYWVVNAGWKDDYPTKRWSTPHYQSVVDHFEGKIKFVQIGMLNKNNHHPKLDNVIDIIDKTNIRQLFNIVYHSQGGVGPITFLQHICAAFKKPYITLHGGREPAFWTSYPTQTTLSNIGQFPCCQTESCWKSKFENVKKPNSVCHLPVIDKDERDIAKCMLSIRPKQVIDSINNYYKNKVLSF